MQFVNLISKVAFIQNNVLSKTNSKKVKLTPYYEKNDIMLLNNPY